MTQKNLGIATAYGYAKSKGYTGTEEEFALLMASYATVAQAAAESAAQAAQSASTAASSSATAQTGATTATNKAKDAEAYAIGKRDGEDVGSTDPAYHNNSKYYAEAAEESATRIQDAIDAATTAAQNANTAAGSANTAAGSANTAASAANAAAGKIDNMTVSATELSAGSAPTATISEVSGHKHIEFGIPVSDISEDDIATIEETQAMVDDYFGGR